MFYIVLAVHSVLCFSLIGLVLIQQGKGADMGAAFGGGSNTLFGAGGATDFLTKLTTSIAVAFMVTSIILVKTYQTHGMQTTGAVIDPLKGSVMEGQFQKKEIPQEAPKAAAEAVVPAPAPINPAEAAKSEPIKKDDAAKPAGESAAAPAAVEKKGETAPEQQSQTVESQTVAKDVAAKDSGAEEKPAKKKEAAKK